MITCTCITGFVIRFTAESLSRILSPITTSVRSPCSFTLAFCGAVGSSPADATTVSVAVSDLAVWCSPRSSEYETSTGSRLNVPPRGGFMTYWSVRDSSGLSSGYSACTEPLTSVKPEGTESVTTISLISPVPVAPAFLTVTVTVVVSPSSIVCGEGTFVTESAVAG